MFNPFLIKCLDLIFVLGQTNFSMDFTKANARFCQSWTVANTNVCR